MNLHANAALSLKGRRELCLAVVERERTVAAAAEAAGVSVRCARKWVGRYRSEGEVGLRDRSSAPHRIPHRTGEQRVEAIAALRRLRFTGPEIAEVLEMPISTVSGILRRIGMGKLGRLGLEPAVRYERNGFTHERRRPSELHGERAMAYGPMGEEVLVHGMDAQTHYAMAPAFYNVVLLPAIRLTRDAILSASLRRDQETELDQPISKIESP